MPSYLPEHYVSNEEIEEVYQTAGERKAPLVKTTYEDK